MTRPRLMAVAVLLIVAGCQQWPPPRPANVPEGAVGIQVPKSYEWQYCEYDAKAQADRCAIYNRAGQIIDSGRYVPYDGGPAATTDELKIIDGPADNLIFLANGRVLLLTKDFANQKQWVDYAKKFWPIRVLGPEERELERAK